MLGLSKDAYSVRNFGQMRTVAAVNRATAILDLVSRAVEPPRVSAIARSLGIPRNTTYELVHTLASHSFLELGADGRVRLGFRLFELGGAYAQSLDLIREARQVAHEVAARCNETCHVVRLEGREVVYLVKEEGNQLVRMASVVGRRLPAHGTGVGKVLLAHLPRPELLKRLEGVQLEQMTPRTITSLPDLLNELDRTAARGYATDDGESTPDVRCVAAPIRDDSGEVVAAMSISVPAGRMGARRQRELAELVVEAAVRLSRRLGNVIREPVAL